MVENFTPRVLDKLGLGWDAIHAANPRAVLVRMPAFGLDGPWRDRPGFAQNMEQASGLAWITGQPRRPAPHPARAVRPQRRHARGDRRCSWRSTGATATGEGSLVEVALFDAALRARGRSRSSSGRAYGTLLERDGNRSPWRRAAGRVPAPGTTTPGWRCRSTTDEQWAALAERARPSRPRRRPGLATSPAGGRATTSSTRRSRAWAAEQRPRRGRRHARSTPASRPRRLAIPRRAPATRSSWPAASTRSSTTRWPAAARARPCRSGSTASTAGSARPAPDVRPAHRRDPRRAARPAPTTSSPTSSADGHHRRPARRRLMRSTPR